MKIGDIVRISDKSISEIDERKTGVILRFDVYGSSKPHPADFGFPEQIAEILWNGGNKGWILCSRIEIIND